MLKSGAGTRRTTSNTLTQFHVVRVFGKNGIQCAADWRHFLEGEDFGELSRAAPAEPRRTRRSALQGKHARYPANVVRNSA